MWRTIYDIFFIYYRFPGGQPGRGGGPAGGTGGNQPAGSGGSGQYAEDGDDDLYS